MKTLIGILAFGFCSTQAFSQTATAFAGSSSTGATALESKNSEKTIQSIIDDLVKLHIITDRNKVSFSLSYDAMKVNDKKQSEETLDTFRKKYGIGKSDSINYAKDHNTVSTSIVH